ncbi:MAG: alpha/beta hydrolase [Lentisphaerae bacterium]|nr:alpha/beta hydrolase [Lentisphaerota bacterium]
MTSKLKNIILPGWAMSTEPYAAVSGNLAEVYDFGFFSEKSTMLPPVFDSEIEDMCGSPCIITAHSLGSVLAFGKIQALSNVKALIVYSGFAKFAKANDNLSGQPAETILSMKKQLMNNPAVLLKSFYRNMSSPSKCEFNVPETLNVPALDAGLDILLNCDCRDKLAEIKIPVLIIHGAQDRIVNVKTADELAGNIRVSRLHVFKNAGHAVPFTHSNESKKITEKFLTDYDIHQYN